MLKKWEGYSSYQENHEIYLSSLEISTKVVGQVIQSVEEYLALSLPKERVQSYESQGHSEKRKRNIRENNRRWLAKGGDNRRKNVRRRRKYTEEERARTRPELTMQRQGSSQESARGHRGEAYAVTHCAIRTRIVRQRDAYKNRALRKLK